MLFLHGLAAHVDYPPETLHGMRENVAGELPDWLAAVPRLRATGVVHRLRDGYGTRFGVIAEFEYAGGRDPHCYLLDIDSSTFVLLQAGGLYDTVDAAADAWRAGVG